MLVWKEIEYSRLSEPAKQNLVQEVNLLRELRHGNIVRYYDRVIDKTRSTLFIVMEYCEGGDLATYISKMKASQYVIGKAKWLNAVPASPQVDCRCCWVPQIRNCRGNACKSAFCHTVVIMVIM